MVDDPLAKLDGYVAHRLDRERRLLEALDAGALTVDEMLDAAWDDAPDVLRPAATVTLGAHLDKLEEEGRLPAGVERPAGPGRAARAVGVYPGAEGAGHLPGRRLRRARSIAAVSGVAPMRSASSKIARSVSPMPRTRCSAARGRSRLGRARRRC